MRTELIKIADELDAAVEKSEAADREAFVYPLRIAMRDASKRLRASLQEEERVTPEPSAADWALSALVGHCRHAANQFERFGQPHHAIAMRRVASNSLRLAGLSDYDLFPAPDSILDRSPAPPSEETPQAHPQTLEHEGQTWEMILWGTFHKLTAYERFLVVLPNGEHNIFNWHLCSKTMNDGMALAYKKCGAALYRSVPSQEPPTPQERLEGLKQFAAQDDGSKEFYRGTVRTMIAELEEAMAAAPTQEVRG